MAGETGPAINPIEQFSITPLIPIRIAGHDFSLTNSSLYMLIAVGIACLVMTAGARGGPGIPGRLQSAAELAYEFIAGMLRSATGEKGMRFFPMVFSIFMFVLITNLIGLLPYSFTVTSQIVVTAALALAVFFTVIVVGLYEHGFSFFKLFVPLGRADLHSAAGGGDRDHLVLDPPAEPFGASVRQHAGRTHHAQRFRQLRRHAAGRRRGGQGARGAAVRDDRSASTRSNCWSRSCRPMSSPC